MIRMEEDAEDRKKRREASGGGGGGVRPAARLLDLKKAAKDKYQISNYNKAYTAL